MKKLMTFLGLGLLSAVMIVQSADKKPTVDSLNLQVQENNKAILEAAQDIMKQAGEIEELKQQVETLKQTVADDDKALQAADDNFAQVDTMFGKLVDHINDLNQRLSVVEHTVNKVAVIEHNKDAYGQEANQ